MSKNSLEILFESKTRLKVLKFLYRNLDQRYTVREVITHTQELPAAVRQELAKLADIKLLRKETHRSRFTFTINRDFEYFAELRDLLLKQPPSEKRRLIESISRLGRIKLAIIAGIFLDKETKDALAIDLFLVGDDIERRKLITFLKNLEAEIGKEVRFATMEKEEFKYRLSMFDRFVRVMLESPHEKLIDKLGLE